MSHHLMTHLSPAPSGPPLDIQLEALMPRSIKVTWKVNSKFLEHYHKAILLFSMI